MSTVSIIDSLRQREAAEKATAEKQYRALVQRAAQDRSTKADAEQAPDLIQKLGFDSDKLAGDIEIFKRYLQAEKAASTLADAKQTLAEFQKKISDKLTEKAAAVQRLDSELQSLSWPAAEAEQAVRDAEKADQTRRQLLNAHGALLIGDEKANERRKRLGLWDSFHHGNAPIADHEILTTHDLIGGVRSLADRDFVTTGGQTSSELADLRRLAEEAQSAFADGKIPRFLVDPDALAAVRSGVGYFAVPRDAISATSPLGQVKFIRAIGQSAEQFQDLLNEATRHGDQWLREIRRAAETGQADHFAVTGARTELAEFRQRYGLAGDSPRSEPAFAGD